MERLTFTDLELEMNGHDCTVKLFDKTVGNFCDKVCEEFQYNCPFDKLGRKLKAYEDTGLTPEQILAMDEEYTKLAKELGEYKRLEEQGRLIKLPCKVGDTVWENDEHLEVLTECKVDRFAFDNAGELYCIYSAKNGFFSAKRYIEEFGKTLFLTKAEAEKALEEMKWE